MGMKEGARIKLQENRVPPGYLQGRLAQEQLHKSPAAWTSSEAPVLPLRNESPKGKSDELHLGWKDMEREHLDKKPSRTDFTVGG